VGGDGDQVVVADLVGQELVSDWLEITQARIDQFAGATDDAQWIHTDPARAAEGPFGTTIAHGFLTLSLLVPLFEQALPPLEGVRLTVNYGLDRVRFTAPVASGSRVRGRFTVESVEEVSGGRQATVAAVVEREHETKPACVARWLARFYD
jgi:acyl dehydratase